MKKLPVAFFVFLLTFFASNTFTQAFSLPFERLQPAQLFNHKRLIVTFKADVNRADQETVINQFSAEKIKRLSLVNAQVVSLSRQRIDALKANPAVLQVEEDAQVFTLCHRWWQRCHKPSPLPTPLPSPTPSPTPSPSPSPSTSQILPWGVNRIDAEQVWSTTTADPIKVAIVDTGVDLDHPDLAANIKGGVNTIYPWRSYDDDSGHGTHVGGIVAAVNNTIGVVGVGPQIDLYGVKVLNSGGSGYVSDIIEGIQWSINNNMQVINMSLGTTADVQAFHDAVTLAKNAGITIVAAAGNSGPAGNSVLYPAKYPEVIAVSASNKSDGQPSWSSGGPEVDLAAPGDSIYSTYRGGGYRTLSGTSMASPHVAGVAALVLATHLGFTPDQVQAHLKSTAEFLSGLSSNQQGSGLVDAEGAIN